MIGDGVLVPAADIQGRITELEESLYENVEKIASVNRHWSFRHYKCDNRKKASIFVQ